MAKSFNSKYHKFFILNRLKRVSGKNKRELYINIFKWSYYFINSFLCLY